LETAALQAIHAQQVASKARDKEKAQSATGRRFHDLVELRVSGVETADALKPLPQNDSEQADRERDGQDHPNGEHSGNLNPDTPHVDLKA